MDPLKINQPTHERLCVVTPFSNPSARYALKMEKIIVQRIIDANQQGDIVRQIFRTCKVQRFLSDRRISWANLKFKAKK